MNNKFIDFIGQLIISIGLIYLILKIYYLQYDIRRYLNYNDELNTISTFFTFFEALSRMLIFPLWTFVFGYSFIFLAYWVKKKHK
ncbi:hypothetical protein FACS189485_17150 [Spirochaetia bacterium]|nr:hypothetical protein FACS189485_17150 [Spirochaetia bacterium]